MDTFDSASKMSMPINFVTQRNDKANQIKDVFRSDFQYQILHDHLQDYQGSDAYVLTQKCTEAVANGIPCPLITDITSVCFNALGGLPGALTPSFVQKLTSEELYKLLEAWEDKSAYVVYSLAYLEKEGAEVQIFQGCLSGTVVKPKKSNSSGWEACFQPDGYTKSYSELPKNVQVDISERKKALRSLKTYLIAKEFF